MPDHRLQGAQEARRTRPQDFRHPVYSAPESGQSRQVPFICRLVRVAREERTADCDRVVPNGGPSEGLLKMLRWWPIRVVERCRPAKLSPRSRLLRSWAAFDDSVEPQVSSERICARPARALSVSKLRSGGDYRSQETKNERRRKARSPGSASSIPVLAPAPGVVRRVPVVAAGMSPQAGDPNSRFCSLYRKGNTWPPTHTILVTPCAAVVGGRSSLLRSRT